MKRDTFENKASIFGYTFTLILTIISLILFLAWKFYYILLCLANSISNDLRIKLFQID